nr:hypothetical protein [uncultured Helicobacter sp.]
MFLSQFIFLFLFYKGEGLKFASVGLLRYTRSRSLPLIYPPLALKGVRGRALSVVACKKANNANILRVIFAGVDLLLCNCIRVV